MPSHTGTTYDHDLRKEINNTVQPRNYIDQLERNKLNRVMITFNCETINYPLAQLNSSQT